MTRFFFMGRSHRSRTGKLCLTIYRFNQGLFSKYMTKKIYSVKEQARGHGKDGLESKAKVRRHDRGVRTKLDTSSAEHFSTWKNARVSVITIIGLPNRLVQEYLDHRKYRLIKTSHEYDSGAAFCISDVDFFCKSKYRQTNCTVLIRLRSRDFSSCFEFLLIVIE